MSLEGFLTVLGQHGRKSVFRVCLSGSPSLSALAVFVLYQGVKSTGECGLGVWGIRVQSLICR